MVDLTEVPMATGDNHIAAAGFEIEPANVSVLGCYIQLTRPQIVGTTSQSIL
jgi:hypothetical protein